MTNDQSEVLPDPTASYHQMIANTQQGKRTKPTEEPQPTTTNSSTPEREEVLIVTEPDWNSWNKSAK